MKTREIKYTLKKTFLRERCWFCGRYAPQWHPGVGGGGNFLSDSDAATEWTRHKKRCERNFSFTAFYPMEISSLPFGHLGQDEMPQRRLV